MTSLNFSNLEINDNAPTIDKKKCLKIFHIDALIQQLIIVRNVLNQNRENNYPLEMYNKLDEHYFKLIQLLHNRS